jgi:hypothetical protein
VIFPLIPRWQHSADGFGCLLHNGDMIVSKGMFF